MTTIEPLAPLYGLLLAGGRSRRMGRDKASLVYDESGTPQARRGLDLLAHSCARVCLSLRPGQELPSGVTESDPVIRDIWPEIGPLGGILSAMDAEPRAAWLAVACDLPRLDADTLVELAAHRTSGRSLIAYRSAHDGLPEPLCAIYEPAARAVLHRYREAGERCPRRILHEEGAFLLDARRPDALDNANTPEDARRMRMRSGEDPDPAFTILYFGSLAAARGVREESVSCEARTPETLFARLSALHGLNIPQSTLRVAVNHEFAGWETELRDNDVVAFLPPMAGG